MAKVLLSLTLFFFVAQLLPGLSIATDINSDLFIEAVFKNADPYSDDYHKRLGVPKTATPKEVKKAFRALMIFYHPDGGHYKGEDASVILGRLAEAEDGLRDQRTSGSQEQTRSHWDSDELREAQRKFYESLMGNPELWIKFFTEFFGKLESRFEDFEKSAGESSEETARRHADANLQIKKNEALQKLEEELREAKDQGTRPLDILVLNQPPRDGYIIYQYDAFYEFLSAHFEEILVGKLSLREVLSFYILLDDKHRNLKDRLIAWAMEQRWNSAEFLHIFTLSSLNMVDGIVKYQSLYKRDELTFLHELLTVLDSMTLKLGTDSLGQSKILERCGQAIDRLEHIPNNPKSCELLLVPMKEEYLEGRKKDAAEKAFLRMMQKDKYLETKLTSTPELRAKFALKIQKARRNQVRWIPSNK